MDFETIKDQVDGIPYVLPQMARELYQFVISTRPHRCLELGFAHGVSSCYIAAALSSNGRGHLDTVDLLEGLNWQHPSIEELLAKAGLESFVSIHREHTQYTWFLLQQIKRQTTAPGQPCEPLYDFCFIDGAKNWTIDGCAFFLVDKLLKPGGWILFDDVNWVYRKKALQEREVSDGITIRSMSEQELDTPHIAEVFTYLVRQHPGYSNFKLMDDWFAWAQKTPDGSRTVQIDTSPEFARRQSQKL